MESTKYNMLISSIRHKIKSEFDLHRSALFMRYVMHYLKMFAFLGMIIPALIVADHFSTPKTKEETITNKFYRVIGTSYGEYHIFTNTFHFISDNTFFENTNINDRLELRYTPIFKHITSALCKKEAAVYVYEPDTVYWWLVIFFACLTIILSINFVIRTWNCNRKKACLKYDSMLNQGVIIAFLSISFIISILI